MTLIFSGNDYKYELEGVMKLFIPATLFTHVFSDSIDTEDDYVFAQKKDNADNVCLSVKVRYDGKTCEKEEFVHFESDMELSLSRLLFKAMSEITGIVPKWGVITGIRPVKRVNDMLSEGMNKAEIFKAMESRYLCSEEKCDIAYKTAITQKPVLDELEKDSFSLYVSVPFCPTRCSYCSFVSQSIEGCMKLIPEYVNKLCEEIVYTAKITKKLGLKLDTFKVWAEQIFGWYYFVERSVYEPYEDGHGGHYVTKSIRKRLVNKQYLIVARGAAKSMYGSCLQNFFLNVDVTTTHQITTAPTMKQAEEVLSPIRTAITRSRGPFYKFLTEGSLQNTTGSKANRMKLASTKKGIENFLTGSLLEIRPMRIDKLQGLQLKVATVDEWLSGDIREDVIGAIEQGASKVNDYLIVAISSEGTVRNGAGDTIKMELMDILKGDYINPHVSIWWYKLDSIDEVADPDKWLKANPNLGKTVSYETYQLDVERAEKAPAARNDILAKRFGLPMEGYTYYFTYEETLLHRHR